MIIMDKQTVAKVANLARLHTSEEDNERLAGELSAIFDWIEQLNEIDTENVEPMTSAIPHDGHWRKDEVSDGGIQDKVLENAPEDAEGFFVVPKVIE